MGAGAGAHAAGCRMCRYGGSVSCNNLQTMASAGGSAARPAGFGMGSRAFPPVGQTPMTALHACEPEDASASAAAGAEPDGGGGAQDEPMLSDLISRCKHQGARMSMSVARNMAGKPMQQN